MGMFDQVESQGTVSFGGRTYTLDAHGFLDPPEQWDEAFAEGLGGFGHL